MACDAMRTSPGVGREGQDACVEDGDERAHHQHNAARRAPKPRLQQGGPRCKVAHALTHMLLAECLPCPALATELCTRCVQQWEGGHACVRVRGGSRARTTKASWKIWPTMYPLASPVRSVDGSWTQDSSDRRKVQPRTAVPMTDQTMPLGTTLSAFFVSSAN